MCEACDLAEEDPISGSYDANCMNCKARFLARSPQAWKAIRAETAVPLQEEIRRQWGSDNYNEGRQLVWSWIKKLGLNSR